jgi:hypothetical protein
MKSLLGKGAGYSMNPGLEPILPSQLIRKVINTRGADFTVRDLFKTFGSQSFGLIFIAMALPLTIPLPPLIGFIPAGLICTWALQRALGITQLWLPRTIAQKKVSQNIIDSIENKALPLCEKLEKRFFKSKQLNRLKESEIRLASIAVVFLSMLIMLPTPFLNSIPAVIIIIMGLTILSNNRRLLWINMSFSLLALVFIGSTLYVGLEALIEEVNGFIQSY